MANYRPIECPQCLMHVGDKGCVLHRAAPALLEALEALVRADAPASCCAEGIQARTAIAQAKGQA